jgi:Na+/proline symporter
MNGLGDMVKQDISSGKNLTPAGYSKSVAIPGSIQFVSAGSKAVGGTWTGMMCMTYMFALMGIQSSPAFSMWAFANKTSRAFRWQQVVASSVVIGIILFTFTIFQGVGGHILLENGIFSSVNDKNLVPQLINLLSDSMPWLVGLLAVCALAAMQSTGAAYMSTFSAMVTRDIYIKYIAPTASDRLQKLCGRIFVFIVAGMALIVAANSTQAIVMLGGLAVAYGFQMYPALIGICYYKGFTRQGVVMGLVVITLALKLVYFFWQGKPQGATIQTATGFSQASVRLLDAGHSAPTFLNREFGYQVAADQLLRLRIIMTLVTFIVPLALVYCVFGGLVGAELLGLAWLIMMAGLLLERWLFFAEARHVVRLYQGEQRT